MTPHPPAQSAQFSLRPPFSLSPFPPLPPLPSPQQPPPPSISAPTTYYSQHPVPHVSSITGPSGASPFALAPPPSSLNNVSSHGPYSAMFMPPHATVNPSSLSSLNSLLALPSSSFTVPATQPTLPPPPTSDSTLFHAGFTHMQNNNSSPPYFTHSSASVSAPSYSIQSYPFSSFNQSGLTSPLSAQSVTRTVRANVWYCPLGCGQSYKKSSGRSIRRHYVSCFRLQHHTAAATMSDLQLSSLIAEQQDTGQLQTGLRRWRMRSARRRVDQLKDEERWECVWRCGKRYRSTSTRSIQRHIAECDRRPGGGRAGRNQSAAASSNDSGGGRETEEDDEDEEIEDEGVKEDTSETQHSHKSHSQSIDTASLATVATSSSSTSSPPHSATSTTTVTFTSSQPMVHQTVSSSTIQLLSAAAADSLSQHQDSKDNKASAK